MSPGGNPTMVTATIQPQPRLLCQPAQSGGVGRRGLAPARGEEPGGDLQVGDPGAEAGVADTQLAQVHQERARGVQNHSAPAHLLAILPDKHNT